MAFILKEQSKAHTNSIKVSICKATEGDAYKIMEMVNSEAKCSGAVLHVFEDEVKEWIKNDLCFVAKTESGDLVGHHSASVWLQSGWVELRAAVVLPEYRGNGINGQLKNAIINAIEKKYPGVTIVSVKNKTSNGRQVLEELGFRKITQSEAPSELFNIGPAGEVYDIYVYTASKNTVKELIRS